MLLALRTGEYEHVMSAIFVRAARRATSALDVGANIGLYSVLAAGTMPPGAGIVSVEPGQVARQFLERNLSYNGITNVEVLGIAASDIRERARLWRPAGEYGRASLVPTGPEYEDVDCAPLGEMLKGRTFDLVKIDVEGYEYRVVRGIGDIIASEAVVFLEYWSQPHGQAMRALGANLWPHVARIDERHRRASRVSWEDLDARLQINVVASSSAIRLDEALGSWL